MSTAGVFALASRSMIVSPKTLAWGGPAPGDVISFEVD